MRKEFKAMTFALFTLILGGSFVIQWISTGSIMQAFIFVLQILILLLGIPIIFAVLLIIGLRIFK